MKRSLTRDGFWGALAITASVGLISVLHYVTSLHSVVLHEIFKRLYYIPVVVAAVTYGVRAGLATSGFASVLYVPHIMMSWHAWPVLELDQYGDVLLFNVVAAVTGTLADRLRAERNRYRRAAVDLEAANRELVARTDERVRMDRLVTIGRLASGLAHEVRNPLGSLLGCLEILEPAVSAAPDKQEFVAVARGEIDRLNTVVREFLEFARPAMPSRRVSDVAELVGSAIRLAQPNLACRGVDVRFAAPDGPVLVDADSEQLQRAVVNLLLDQFAPAHGGSVRVSIVPDASTARIGIEVPDVHDAPRLVTEVFEPFPEYGNGHGLSLAVARRLIENQGGAVRAEADGTTLRYVIDLPLEHPLADAATAPGEHCQRRLVRSA